MHLKRFVADLDLNTIHVIYRKEGKQGQESRRYWRRTSDSPALLSALKLRRGSFEALPVAGGWMAVGIPSTPPKNV